MEAFTKQALTTKKPERPADVKNVHWTVGGPYFIEYLNADFSEEWSKEAVRMAFCAQRLG